IKGAHGRPAPEDEHPVIMHRRRPTISCGIFRVVFAEDCLALQVEREGALALAGFAGLASAVCGNPGAEESFPIIPAQFGRAQAQADQHGGYEDETQKTVLYQSAITAR